MYYQRQGDLPPKPFTVHRTRAGSLAHEEMVTSGGFRGPSSLLYRLRPSTAIMDVEALHSECLTEWEEAATHNHSLNLDRVSGDGTFVSARVPLFFNDDLIYSVCSPSLPSNDFYRNAWADELIFVVNGRGILRSSFGAIEYRPLDLLYVPRGVVIRLEETQDRQIYTITESRAALGPPPRQRGVTGQLSYTGMYLESDLRTPRFDGPIDVRGKQHIIVKSAQRLTCQIVPAHPFDAIGWSGALYPYALNMDDLTPTTGRVHTTPDIYQIFESDGLYVSAITPMRLPDHPDSTPAQPDHLSDYDEIFHRVGREGPTGREAGTVTLHSRANPHGAALVLKERARRESTSGYGFIIDAARPVSVARSAMPADTAEYFKSWAPNGV